MIIVQQLYTPRWKRLDASFQVITEPFLNRCVYDACKAFLIFVKIKKNCHLICKISDNFY